MNKKTTSIDACYSKWDAIVTHPSDEKIVYFFTGDIYYKYRCWEGVIDGYPKLIREGWKGLPIHLDAALRHPKAGSNKIYFFKGEDYYRYDLERDKLDDPEPKPISSWTGVPNNLNGAVNHPTDPNVVYFFKGNKYYRYNRELEKVTDSFPRKMGGEFWPGIPENIDAVVQTPIEKDSVFFFKGNEYYRYSFSAREVAEGFPQPVGGKDWKGAKLDLIKTEDFPDTFELRENLALLSSNTAEIYFDVNRIHIKSKYAYEKLLMIKHIKVKLDDLYKDVEIASDVLEYMEVLPDVGEVAAEIRKVVDKFKDSLKTPKKAMDKLEHGTRDIRTIVKDIDNRSKAVKDDIKRFQKEESFSLSDLCDAMRCISSIPPGSVQDDLIESLEEFSVDANVIVEDANKKQDELLKYANEGNNLISDVEREFRKLTHMDHVIDDVRDVLDPLFHILKKVEHELDKEVKIEEHLLFVEITLFEFRIKDVLRGIDDIAHWVMKELNKLAEDVLRPVFDDLHLHHFLNHFMHFKLPNIPYLNYIKFIEDEIRDYFDAFDTKLRHLVDKIENRIYKDIEPVAEEMKKLKKTYEQCK